MPQPLTLSLQCCSLASWPSQGHTVSHLWPRPHRFALALVPPTCPPPALLPGCMGHAAYSWHPAANSHLAGLQPGSIAKRDATTYHIFIDLVIAGMDLCSGVHMCLLGHAEGVLQHYSLPDAASALDQAAAHTDASQVGTCCRQGIKQHWLPSIWGGGCHSHRCLSNHVGTCCCHGQSANHQVPARPFVNPARQQAAAHAVASEKAVCCCQWHQVASSDLCSIRCLLPHIPS